MSQTGIVLFFNDAKGWGFIGRRSSGLPDLFVHRDQVVAGLMRGDQVRFDVAFDEVRGKLCATNVTGGTCTWRRNTGRGKDGGKGGGKGEASAAASTVASAAVSASASTSAPVARGAEEASEARIWARKWDDWTPSVGSGTSIRSSDASFDDSASLRVLGRLERRYWRRQRADAWADRDSPVRAVWVDVWADRDSGRAAWDDSWADAWAHAWADLMMLLYCCFYCCLFFVLFFCFCLCCYCCFIIVVKRRRSGDRSPSRSTV